MREEEEKEKNHLGDESDTTMTSDPNGPEESNGRIDKAQIKVVGGFLRNRLEDDPFYVAKIFIKMLGKHIFRIATRITIILSLAYLIRYLLVTYTIIPKFYSSLILIFLLILYYSRQDKNYASKYLVRFMIMIGFDRFITYKLHKPPGTFIVLLLLGGLFYMTYASLFKKVKEDANNESA